MGAFGRLLQSYFGNTIHDVNTWKLPPKKKKLKYPDKNVNKSIQRVPPVAKNSL